MGDFTHLSDANQARMVHLGTKPESERSAKVQAQVRVSEDCAAKLTGPMLTEIERTARIAGIQAAKQTSLLIPLCHQVALRGIDVEIVFEPNETTFKIVATASTNAATGVEMEAMCAASIAALTVYDMVKAVDPEAVVSSLGLIEKKGGKKGHWSRSRGLTLSHL
jgi:cyclic pyranopterin monophosphate synthase